MSHFNRTWDTAYEATPANTDDVSNDAQRMREMKVDLRQRLEIDHSWAGNENDGFHKTATMMKRSSDPPSAVDKLVLYTKTNSDKLYGIEPTGDILEITPPVGSGMAFFLSTEPPGYIFADGRTIGNSTSSADHEGERFRELFDAIKGIGYGNSGSEDFDASDTVQLPDLRDRVPLGQNSMGNSNASRISHLSTSMAATGGESVHQLTMGEMPSHDHGDTNGNNASGLQVYAGTIASSGGESGLVINNAVIPAWDDTFGTDLNRVIRDNSNHNHGISHNGGNGNHNNVQPFLAINWIIKY